MSILIRDHRGEQPQPAAGSRRGGGPSVREVCLLGVSGPGGGSAWAAGDRLEWGGRVYRVSDTRERGEAPAEAGTRYVFLSTPGGDRPAR